MKMFKFKRIQIRLLFWFILLALIPLFIGITIAYYLQVEEIKKEEINTLIVVRDLKIERLNFWLEERGDDLETLAESFAVQNFEGMFNKEKRTEEDIAIISNIREIMNLYVENFPDYDEIFVINPDSGIIEISTDKSSEGMDKSKDDYYTRPLQSRDFYIKDIYYSSSKHKPVMAFSIPIFCSQHSGEHIVGILVCRVDLYKSFFPLVQDTTGLGETGETLIVNKDVIALNELRWHEDAPLKLKIKAQPAFMASQGYSDIIESTDYRGEEVLAAFTYIPQTGWGLVAKRDLEEIYAPVRRMLINLIILVLITAAIIYFISRILANSFTKPLINMVKVSNKIQSGDFSVRNKIYNDDEIGYLADSYNKMTDSIESKIRLEQRRAEISNIMIPLLRLKDFNQDIVYKLMEITDSNMGVFYVLNDEKSKFEYVASVGIDATLVKFFDAQCREGEFGKAITSKKISHLKNIPSDTVFKFKTIIGNVIPKEIVTIPIVVENQVVAIISLASLKKYEDETLEILNNSFSAINMAFSNLLANEETRRLNKEIKGKNVELQKQTEELQLQTEELQLQTEELQSQTEELQVQSDELQEQNIELDMQKREVEEANRLKSEFLSNMSHELRTPLNSIMALSRTLTMQAKDKISSEENKYLEIIERNGKNLLTLINDILDLSKIEAGKLEIALQTFSINSIIQNIKENLSSIAKEKEIKIYLELADNLPKIESDPEKVYQILQNVIDNAVKFTQKGSVTISADTDENQMVIKVIDTGIGVSQEELPYVFEEFRQADGSTSRQFGGTGLGLAIVHKLMNRLRGKIEVQSELGKGSIFTIYLPLKWSGDIESEKVTTLSKSWELNQKEKAVKETSLDENKNIEKEKIKENPRILIVEDNEETVVQIKIILENEGYLVDIANSGQAALDYIKHTIPDGIILDLMMPEIDGFEVLENIRSTSRTADIPVLILTAKDLTAEDFKKLSANNIQQLLYKGAVDKDELIFTIKLMLKNGLKDEQKSESKEQKEIAREKKKIDISQTKILPKKEGLSTILVAEDNPDNMLTTRAILKDKYNLIEAVDGESALDKAQRDIPDLILMDISLPKMDGLTVVKLLKENKATKNIPVIAVTARAMKGEREKIIKSGCDDYISKPIDPEIMLGKIDEWIKKKKISR
jgi:signal transduction histidine kinase/DNA-binding response OmpR family regulator/HAMP domain-containing protein